MPPVTRRDAVVDTLHGIDVPDPYRWLEDGDDPEVQRWVAEQNAVTRAALGAVPQRGWWHERLVALMGLPVVQSVELAGDRVVTLERRRNADQAVLCVRPLDMPDVARVLVDPSTTAADGVAAVDWFSSSADGRLVAFGVSEGGSENSILRIVETHTGDRLADEIPNCRAASVAWEPDGSGFFYTRYPDGEQYHRTVHHHTLGADWRDDPVVWADPEHPQTWPDVRLSPDGRRVLVHALVGWTQVDVFVLDRTTDRWTTIIQGVEATSTFRFAGSDRLIGSTVVDAPKGRVVAIDLAAVPASPDGWTTVVPERDVVAGDPHPMKGGFLLEVTDVAVDRLEWWSADGARRVDVSGPAPAAVLDVASGSRSPVALAIFMGFDRPPSLVQITDDGRQVDPWGLAASPDEIPPLTVVETAYRSTDGTEIGVFVIRSQGAAATPDTPTILNGYGGFAIPESPVWSPTIAAWCESGGQYVIAGLRGGLEHGDEWHRAGRREHKQNVFDDFHAAADWLVETGRTSRHKLAIEGRSNGGLLVGVALTQRPDLCRAVSCGVPLLDMIRFPRFLIARLWTDEYGDPDIAEEFAWLHAYSPYHHVVEGGEYPAAFLWTADGDSRVDPLHARKMAAMLQWAAAGQDERPVLLHIEGRAGHGIGKPVTKKADEQADVLAFFSWQLGR